MVVVLLLVNGSHHLCWSAGLSPGKLLHESDSHNRLARADN